MPIVRVLVVRAIAAIVHAHHHFSSSSCSVYCCNSLNHPRMNFGYGTFLAIVCGAMPFSIACQPGLETPCHFSEMV